MNKQSLCKSILQQMQEHNLTIEDLRQYTDSIKIMGRFPLEIYFSDRTTSYDVLHCSEKTNRFPIGVILNNVVYMLPQYTTIVQSNQLEDFCDDIVQWGLKGRLPSISEGKILAEKLVEYHKICQYLKLPLLKTTTFAVSDKSTLNEPMVYDLLKNISYTKQGHIIYALPVASL